MGRVPVIDLAARREEVVEAVRDACTTVGFFLIRNHGVPQAVVDDHFEQNAAFFALSEEEKLKIKVNELNRGFTPHQEETLDPANQREGDTKEGLYFGREAAADAGPMQGPNQWPSPELLPRYRAAITAYFDALDVLGRRLIRLLALALGLEETWFDDKFEVPIALLRPLHYSTRPSNPDEGIFGCGAHTDYGMLTILATDGTPGLQIRQGSVWEDVPSLPSCFVINLGDMLERWTNGRFKSTLHRVVSRGGERYSAAFFFEPSFTTRVECLPCCCGPHDPPKFPPTTSGQHLLDKYAATQTGYVKPAVLAA